MTDAWRIRRIALSQSRGGVKNNAARPLALARTANATAIPPPTRRLVRHTLPVRRIRRLLPCHALQLRARHTRSLLRCRTPPRDTIASRRRARGPKRRSPATGQTRRPPVHHAHPRCAPTADGTRAPGFRGGSGIMDGRRRGRRCALHSLVRVLSSVASMRLRKGEVRQARGVTLCRGAARGSPTQWTPSVQQ